MPAGVSHERGTAGHDFCGRFDDDGADGAFGLFAEPVKPAVALLKDIGEAGKHNHFTEEVGAGVITVTEGHDKSQPSGCLLEQNHTASGGVSPALYERLTEKKVSGLN